MKITNGSIVSMHYTLKNDNGDLLDTSNGQDPLVFTFGSGAIIPGLEAELKGKEEGDIFVATIAPEDAYGVRSDEHVVTVPLSQFDSPENVQVGARFQMGGQGGTIAEVTNVDKDQVTIDTNHPLAGQILHFDIEVVSLEAATAESLSEVTPDQEADCCANGTCSS